MSNSELIVGKTAVINHGDMGMIEVEIEKKLPVLDYYSARVKKVLFKEVRLKETAALTGAMLEQNKTVNILMKPHELIRYVDEQSLN